MALLANPIRYGAAPHALWDRIRLAGPAGPPMNAGRRKPMRLQYQIKSHAVEGAAARRSLQAPKQGTIYERK